jgi:PhnB protein
MISFDGLSEDTQALTPYLTVKDGYKMLDFYQAAFGAEVLAVHHVPETKRITHGTLRIGGCLFFINDEFPQFGKLAPITTGQTSTTIHIQVAEGLDELYARALAAGATGLMEPADQFWGDRFAIIADPSGHHWSIGMTISTLRE